MAHVRTYRPNVRVGNWREDVTLEEDTLKDFLERKERGELMCGWTVRRESLCASIRVSPSEQAVALLE
ncbi:unnamed protein product, partial [Coregonus sp. 'balchen']